MLIGTWNLDAKWADGHARELTALDCDVWLLTEVNPQVGIEGYTLHVTSGLMARGQAWAGVLTRLPSRGVPEPHPASAAAEIAGHVFCSSVLPWSGCGKTEPWRGDSVGEMTQTAVDELTDGIAGRPVIWGGDWNHTLTGAYFGSSRAGRSAILAALDALSLVCPTTDLPHQRAGMTSIDHIAVPARTAVAAASHVSMSPRLSDHDAYVIDAAIA